MLSDQLYRTNGRLRNLLAVVLLLVLLRNNSTAINLQTFTSNCGTRRFYACDQGFQTSAVFFHQFCFFSRPGCLDL